MREILFRGKTKVISGSPYNNGKNDGEWVKGYLYDDVGPLRIRQFETDYARYIPYEIDPKTVGQYTGLTDKYGTKIFEGDIVKKSVNGKELIGVIEYADGSFGVRFADDSGQFICFFDGCEIIGNIHDNPKLLKERERV